MSKREGFFGASKFPSKYQTSPHSTWRLILPYTCIPSQTTLGKTEEHGKQEQVGRHLWLFWYLKFFACCIPFLNQHMLSHFSDYEHDAVKFSEKLFKF